MATTPGSRKLGGAVRAVAVAQLVVLQLVVLAVAGSSPVCHLSLGG